MKELLIAFDVDGTLVNNDKSPITANERIRAMLITLSSMKNTKILVWSGGGELWARQAVAGLGLGAYVDAYGDKMLGTDPDCEECQRVQREPDYVHHHFKTKIKPDIAIDDIQECELGIFNLIVREK